MSKMEKQFADSEEKFVKCTVLYGKTEDSVLYKDAKMTEKATVKEVLNLCMKKMLLVSVTDSGATKVYTPISFKVTENTKVEVVVWDGTASPSAKAVTFKSETVK